MLECTSIKQIFSLHDILCIHSLLGGSGCIRPPASSFFDENRVGVGEYTDPPEGKYLTCLLQKYVQKYGAFHEPKEALWQACSAYLIFTLLHPFLDMNGRTGRILCSWLLCLYGYEKAAPYLEDRWGGENVRHYQAFASGLICYEACLGHEKYLNAFLNNRFFPYFLSEIQSILEEINMSARIKQ